MTKRSGTSIKISLAVCGAFLLGLAASGGLGPLTSTAQASSPGGGNGGGCDEKLLKGNYGYSYDVTIEGLGDFNGIGAQTCDKYGNCAGTDTVMIFGQATTLPFTSVYTVNPDCTGSGVLTYSNGAVVNTVFVLVDGGDEIHFVGADFDGKSAGVAKRR